MPQSWRHLAQQLCVDDAGVEVREHTSHPIALGVTGYPAGARLVQSNVKDGSLGADVVELVQAAETYLLGEPVDFVSWSFAMSTGGDGNG